MDSGAFGEAVAEATKWDGYFKYIFQDPARSLASLNRREFDCGDTVIQAWKREAEDPDQRSKLAADALNLIDPRFHVQAATRRGPHPDALATRNFAALGAMWYLSKRWGLKPQTRNHTQKRVAMPCACNAGGSVCDAVGVAMGLNYKSVEALWTHRAEILRRDPLFFMVLWAELPSVAFLGIPKKYGDCKEGLAFGP